MFKRVLSTLLVLLLSAIITPSYAYAQESFWDRCSLTWSAADGIDKKIVKKQLKKISKINPKFYFEYNELNPAIRFDITDPYSLFNTAAAYTVVEYVEYNKTIIRSNIYMNPEFINDDFVYIHEIIHGLGSYSHSDDEKSVMFSNYLYLEKLTKSDIKFISNLHCG